MTREVTAGLSLSFCVHENLPSAVFGDLNIFAVLPYNHKAIALNETEENDIKVGEDHGRLRPVMQIDFISIGSECLGEGLSTLHFLSL